MPRHARVRAQPCPTLTSQNDTVIYTPGSNSGGFREGARGCTISVGRDANLCLHVTVDSYVNKKILPYFFEKRSIVLQRTVTSLHTVPFTVGV